MSYDGNPFFVVYWDNVIIPEGYAFNHLPTGRIVLVFLLDYLFVVKAGHEVLVPAEELYDKLDGWHGSGHVVPFTVTAEEMSGIDLQGINLAVVIAVYGLVCPQADICPPPSDSSMTRAFPK